MSKEAWNISLVVSYTGGSNSFGPWIWLGGDLRSPLSFSNLVSASGQTGTGWISDTHSLHGRLSSPSQDLFKKVGWSMIMVVSTTRDWKQISCRDLYFKNLTSFCSIFPVRNLVRLPSCRKLTVYFWSGVEFDLTSKMKSSVSSAQVKFSQRVYETAELLFSEPSTSEERRMNKSKRKRAGTIDKLIMLPSLPSW